MNVKMKTSGRGSRNSTSFTPKIDKVNAPRSRRSVSALNLDNVERNPNDTLFDTLMSDPTKRMMIMELLSQERDNIEKYKQKKVMKLRRNERLLRCESPTALLRRRALERNRRDSDCSSTTSESKSTKSDSSSSTKSSIPFHCLLEGVVAYVEIRSKEGDRSAGAKALMQAMGATIKNTFSADVTHVVFKEGSFTTYQKAKLKKVHLVSVLWLEAVRKNKCRVPEKSYPALGTEAFDANITQICEDYEHVVNEERRRSQAKGLLSPFGVCIRSRKTALPEELKSLQYAVDIARPSTGGRLSEFVIPASQDFEAESVISCASGTLPYRRAISAVAEEESDRFDIPSPEITSDDDSDCGVINGHSFKRDSSGLSLDILQNRLEVDNAVPSKSSSTTNNTSSTRSASLLSRKSDKRKSSYQIVDMDLTANLDKENAKSRKRGSGKKTKRDSILVSDNSTNFLDDISGKRPENKTTYKNPDLSQTDKLFKEPYVNLGSIGKIFHSAENISIISPRGKFSNPIRMSQSTSDLIGKKQAQKKCSVSSDETPSLRFSSSSKNTTKSIRVSGRGNECNNQENPGKRSNSEEMPSLRISTSISSSDTSNKKHCSLHSEEMPPLRISSSPSQDILGKGKNKKQNSRSSSLASEEMPSLRISSSPSDSFGRRSTRSSKSACREIEAKDAQNFSNKKLEKKKIGQEKDKSSEGKSTVKKKRKSESPVQAGEKKTNASRSKEMQEAAEDQHNQDTVQGNMERNNLRSSKKPRNETALMISDGDCNEIDMPKKDPRRLREDSAGKQKSASSLPRSISEKPKSAGSLPRLVHTTTTVNKNQMCDEDQQLDVSKLQSKIKVNTGNFSNLHNDKSLSNQGNLIQSSSNLSARRCSSRNPKKQLDFDSTPAKSTRSSASFKSNEFTPLSTSVVTNIIASLNTPKPNQQDANNIPESKGKSGRAKEKTGNRKFRKLYNLNESVEEALKNFEWADAIENKDDAATFKNVVPKKTITVPLVPIGVTPMAKKLLEKCKTIEAQDKKVKVSKKEKIPSKPKKKVCLDSSKDEQKELADEYVNKTTKRKVDTEAESKSERKRLLKISKRSQRLSQFQKQNYKENSNGHSDSDEPIVPELNRRSTCEFVQASPTKSQKRGNQRNKKKRTSIVCTRMHKPEVQIFMQIVRKLGSFYVEDEVTDKTTHLVVGESKRTINLLKALARGCWILKQEWLFRSLEAGKWVPEEDFELVDFSPAIQQCRVERRAFGSMYSMDIYENCGPIYIARSSIPRRSDLQELVQLCKGTLTNIAYNASIIVGEWVRYENVVCVTEMWILDSITFNKRKSFKKYFIKRDS